MRHSCDWLADLTLPGVWQILQRYRLHYIRGRQYLHSPDDNYAAKLTYIEQCRHHAQTDPAHYVFLYLDEITIYRQPTLAANYAGAGTQPLARRSYRSDTQTRLIATLDAQTGKVVHASSRKLTLDRLRAFYYTIRAAYPEATTIYVAQDNWPVHFHPDVRSCLAPQEFTWQPRLPANWPTTARPNLPLDNLPIQMLFVPTYAPWTNPIEKLWRWLKQQEVHLHPSADDWTTFQTRLKNFLDKFKDGSTDLLRYVGLLPN